MDFTDHVKAFAASIQDRLAKAVTEEATKNFLIMPFIQEVLGYNVFNPDEVIPEFDANVGASTNYKLDYAIFQDGQPTILIECKCYGCDFRKDREWSQLFTYFVATDARIGVLTDGVIYKFYADLERPNKMDKTPFMELNLKELNEHSIRELAKLTKTAFDVDNALTAAAELKYVGGIKALLKEQVKAPEERFVKYFFRELCPDNNFTGQLKESFVDYTKRAMKEFIREEITTLLDVASQPQTTGPDPDIIPDPPEKTVFTEEEQEGFFIVKAILSETIAPNRITYRDKVNWCNILLDDNGWRQIVRFHFNGAGKKLELYSINAAGEKESQKVEIDAVSDIYKYADPIKAIVKAYESK